MAPRQLAAPAVRPNGSKILENQRFISSDVYSTGRCGLHRSWHLILRNVFLHFLFDSWPMFYPGSTWRWGRAASTPQIWPTTAKTRSIFPDSAGSTGSRQSIQTFSIVSRPGLGLGQGTNLLSHWFNNTIYVGERFTNKHIFQRPKGIENYDQFPQTDKNIQV